jgi:hypothetical protein
MSSISPLNDFYRSPPILHYAQERHLMNETEKEEPHLFSSEANSKDQLQKKLETNMTIAGHLYSMTFVGSNCYSDFLEYCEALEKDSSHLLYQLLFSLPARIELNQRSVVTPLENASLHKQAFLALLSPDLAHHNATANEQCEVINRAQTLFLLKGIQIAIELADHDNLIKQLDQLSVIKLDRNFDDSLNITHFENQIINYLLNPSRPEELEQGRKILRGEQVDDRNPPEQRKAAVSKLDKELRQAWLSEVNITF